MYITAHGNIVTQTPPSMHLTRKSVTKVAYLWIVQSLQPIYTYCCHYGEGTELHRHKTLGLPADYAASSYSRAHQQCRAAER